MWVRLRDLGGLSLWVDEAFTWQVARGSISAILSAQLDLHPPVYLTALHFLLPLTGDGEFALRFPAAIFSAVGIAGAWVSARRFGGVVAALVASSVLAFAPLSVAYAREARMYGVAVAFCALILASAAVIDRKPSRSAWLFYVLACALAILTHYTALAIWVGGACMTLQAIRRSPKSWIVANGAIAMVASLWAWIAWSSRDAWQGLSWHPWAGHTAMSDAAIDWATGLAGFPIGPTNFSKALDSPDGRLGLSIAACLFFLMLIGIARLVIAGKFWIAAGLMIGAVAPFVVLTEIDTLRPTWAIRYMLISLPPSAVLIAFGATAWPKRLIAPNLLLAAGLIFIQFFGLQRLGTEERDNWRAVAHQIRVSMQPDDSALVGVEALGTYYLGPILPVVQRPIALGRSAPDILPDLNRAIGPRTGVWLVPREDRLMDPSNAIETILSRYVESRDDQIVGGIPLSRLRLRSGEPFQLGPTPRPIAAQFGPSIQLHEYAVEKVISGGRPTVHLNLTISVLNRLSKDYKLFSHLLDAGSQTVAQRDIVIVDPVGRPSSQFEIGQRTRIDLIIDGEPAKVATGVAVGIGIYEPDGAGARLTLLPTAPENRLILSLAR